MEERVERYTIVGSDENQIITPISLQLTFSFLVPLFVE